MKRQLKRIGWVALTVACIWLWGIVTDSQVLHDELLRLHVVGATDSQEDQAIKLRVRDAVVESLREEMKNLKDVDQAKIYLQENLPKIELLNGENLTGKSNRMKILRYNFFKCSKG